MLLRAIFVFFSCFFEFLRYNGIMETAHKKQYVIVSNLPADISLQLTQNNKTRLHKHSHYEIFYILSGEVKHRFNGKERLLSVGDCFFLSPEDQHEFFEPENALNRDIMIQTNLMENILRLITSSPKDYLLMLSNRTEPVHFSISELLEMENIAQKFSATNNLEKKRSYALELLLKIFNQFSETEEKVSTSTMLIDKIFECLNMPHIIKGGIPELVRSLKYSTSYVRHCFKEHTGRPLTQYFKESRLNYIEYYLKNTNYSLREIADRVGIESLSYLNKLFKKKYSISPIQFRRKYSLHNSTL